MDQTTSSTTRDNEEGPKAYADADGRVYVKNPTKNSRYDMGNAHLFATFDGTGALRRGIMAEGYESGTLTPRITVDGARFIFEKACAIGRLWSLSGTEDAVEIHMDSFLDEKGAAIFQSVGIKNYSKRRRLVAIQLDFNVAAKTPLVLLLQDRLARLKALLPGTERWWAVSGAKVMRPFACRKLRIREGAIKMRGKQAFSWTSNRPPTELFGASRWAHARFDVPLEAGENAEFLWAMAAGGEETARQELTRGESAKQSAADYAEWLISSYHGKDPSLKAMFAAGLNTAVAMFKEFPGSFAGFVAGPDYGYPPRLYFRDGYWTAQILLRFRPDLVRRHILSLARGVHEDGQCPSGIFAPHVLKGHSGGRVKLLDWLPDHYDSPSFFALLVAEYIEATGDTSILEEQVETWSKGSKDARASIWELAQAAMDYLSTKDTDGNGLIEKPYAANDWADNVNRNVWVTYDQGLYAAGLFAIAALAELRKDTDLAKTYREQAEKAKTALNDTLWDEKLGYYVNYKRPDFVEDNFSLDTLVVLRYKLAEEEKAQRLLRAAKKLQTKRNHDQPHGDWGIMCAAPAYKKERDLFSKSSYPLRYHNGADWPYWDGVYAEILVGRGDSDWYYALTRWWEYGLSRGWLTPVEYYSPAYEVGGMLQGWSSMPACACAKLWIDKP